MRRMPALVAASLVLLIADIAGAASLQVSYTVEDKALKGAVSGTALTFALYADPACTVAVDAENVVVDDVDLIERVKRFTPKGGTKGPAAARMVEVLSGVTTAPTVYLAVTGTGVTPIGGACQLQYASADNVGTVLPCASQVGTEVVFEGCNVNVRSGAGATDAAVNSLGNLVVGYNENIDGSARSGSHNLVVGTHHGYASYAGVVGGSRNSATGTYAVSFGVSNVASGQFATVTGGSGNIASGQGSSVSGGGNNRAIGEVASVAGGIGGAASGNASTISGGLANAATADGATVSGGFCNVAGPGIAPDFNSSAGVATVTGGYRNVASGQYSAILGGTANVASGSFATVAGGTTNNASGAKAAVSGGLQNTASGVNASVTGGWNNSATALNSSVGGGQFRAASGTSDWAAGGLYEDF